MQQTGSNIAIKRSCQQGGFAFIMKNRCMRNAVWKRKAAKNDAQAGFFMVILVFGSAILKCVSSRNVSEEPSMDPGTLEAETRGGLKALRSTILAYGSSFSDGCIYPVCFRHTPM